jgi:hypothetical protein
MLRGEHVIKRESSGGIARNSPTVPQMLPERTFTRPHLPHKSLLPVLAPPRYPNLPPTQNRPQETQRNGPEPPYLMLSGSIRRRPARPFPPRSGRKRSKRTTPLTDAEHRSFLLATSPCDLPQKKRPSPAVTACAVVGAARQGFLPCSRPARRIRCAG